MINYTKSAASFSPGILGPTQQQIKQDLGLGDSVYHERYLGLPVFVGRNKRATFQAIKSKV